MAAGKLYIVATPIGNLEDMTDRAKRILGETDIVAAEDTRITQRLFSSFGIQNKMASNHRFNERRQSDFLIGQLEQGKNIALVSDAGTPCISDPGYMIVRDAVEKGIEVVGVCGPSAVVTALSISGFNLDAFTFFGFFPRGGREIRERLRQIKQSDIPVSVLFESPRRIKKTLLLISEDLPDAEICLCNDLTKLYEKVYRGSPHDVLREIDGNPSAEKGEYTLVLRAGARGRSLSPERGESREAMIIDHLVQNGGSIKEAVKVLSEKYKGRIARNEFYAASLNLKKLLPASLPDDRDDESSGGAPC